MTVCMQPGHATNSTLTAAQSSSESPHWAAARRDEVRHTAAHVVVELVVGWEVALFAPPVDEVEVLRNSEHLDD